MRHVLRRPPLAFFAGPAAAPSAGMPTRFLLQLLQAADQRPGQAGTDQTPGEPYRQRDQFLPQQGATGPVSKVRARGHPAAQAVEARLLVAHLECGLFDRTRALHAGHAYLRRAGLLLPAEFTSNSHSDAEADGAATVEGGSSGVGYQLLGAARRTRRNVLGKSDAIGRLQLPAALFRQGGRALRGEARDQGYGPLRLSQSEDRIPAAAQRRDLLPQRDDVFR